VFAVDIAPAFDVAFLTPIEKRAEVAAVVFAGKGRQSAFVLQVSGKSLDPVFLACLHHMPGSNQ
jgi:hypothetical protein